MHYFAYGSNLHPLRLQQRVTSASLLGIARLEGHRISFHKRSEDGSGKCNLVKTDQLTDYIYGAIYRISLEHKPLLDKFEGPGYRINTIEIPFQDQVLSCFTYQAEHSHIDDDLKPYHWYKQLVVLGARYLRFPDSCIAAFTSVTSSEDPDVERNRVRQKLIEKILEYR